MVEQQKPQRNKAKDKEKDYKKKENREEGFESKGKKGRKQKPTVEVQRPQPKPEVKKEEEIKQITIPEVLTIQELADKMKVVPSVIVKKLFMQGKIVTVNQEIDFETAEEIAMEFEILCEKEEVVDVIEELLKEDELSLIHIWKCARIVGDTMGKYHPHGDSSIYESLVVMAQEFKKGMVLVDGHGNFGSIEGDGAAAMRYTEARLTKFTQEAYLADLDKDIIDFGPNFDETEKEPLVLPVRVPNLLINGAEGIAVGMATSIPTHNLGEVIDAVKAYMKNDAITTKQLMKYIKGPDFPTGGIVVNKDDLPEIYETGQGKIKIRGKVEVEDLKGGKKQLVITEIPYTMIGAGIGKFLNDVCNLVETKKTTDIVDISNQSSKEGIRIVLELKKGADVENLKNMLYKKTRLEDTFGVNMLAVANGRPETLGLKAIIEHHVDFQFELTTRKYKTLLAKELDKKEVQEGLIKACDVIDLIIEILRGSKSVKDAKACLLYTSRCV